jgi:hypothetical protein
MIVRIEFSDLYYWKYKPEEHQAQLTVINDLFPGLVENSQNQVVVDLDLVAVPLSEAGVSYTIKPLKHSMFASTIGEKIKNLEHSHEILKGMIFDKGVVAQIHIPNAALFDVNEVDVLEDGCTYELQRLLDEGWRLLCVCPPNSQRRPDYIIGRLNKEKTK